MGLSAVFACLGLACGAFLAEEGSEPPARPDDAGSIDGGDATANGADGGSTGCTDCEPVLLAQSLDEPRAMALSASDVFVASRGADLTQHRIVRIAKAGGQGPTFVENASNTTDLAVDDAFLYVATWDGPTHRMPFGGGTAINVFGCARNFSIAPAMKANDVYFVTQCSAGVPVNLVRADKTNGMTVIDVGESIDGAEGPRYLDQAFGYVAIDDDSVFVSNAHAIKRYPRAFLYNDSPTATIDVTDAFIYNLVVADLLYVRTNSEVRAYSKNGLVVQVLAGNKASLTDFQDATGLIRLPLAVDGNDVYFTKVNPPTVHRVAKTGGAVTDLATATSSPIAVAADATHVYWATKGGEVWRRRR